MYRNPDMSQNHHAWGPLVCNGFQQRSDSNDQSESSSTNCFPIWFQLFQPQPAYPLAIYAQFLAAIYLILISSLGFIFVSWQGCKVLIGFVPSFVTSSLWWQWPLLPFLHALLHSGRTCTCHILELYIVYLLIISNYLHLLFGILANKIKKQLRSLANYTHQPIFHHTELQRAGPCHWGDDTSIPATIVAGTKMWSQTRVVHYLGHTDMPQYNTIIRFYWTLTLTSPTICTYLYHAARGMSISELQ